MNAMKHLKDRANWQSDAKRQFPHVAYNENTVLC